MLRNLWKGLGAGLRAFRRNPGGFKLVAVLSLAMGITRHDAGDLDGALADFNRAIALDPRSAWAYFCRGSILAAMGRFDEAITDFDRGVELDPQLSLFSHFCPFVFVGAPRFPSSLPYPEEGNARIRGSSIGHRFSQALKSGAGFDQPLDAGLCDRCGQRFAGTGMRADAEGENSSLF